MLASLVTTSASVSRMRRLHSRRDQQRAARTSPSARGASVVGGGKPSPGRFPRRTRLFGALLLVVLVLAAPDRALAESEDRGAGRALFQENCAMCHGTDAAGMMGMHPSLRGAVERLTVEGVEVTIRKGRDTVPPMPAFGERLSQEEIDEIVAYLDTLPVGPRNFGGESGMMDMNGMMDGGMLVGMVVCLLLIAAVVVASVLLMRRFWGATGSSRAQDDHALRVLEERYARGEIDHDEFEERRRVLQR